MKSRAGGHQPIDLGLVAGIPDLLEPGQRNFSVGDAHGIRLSVNKQALEYALHYATTAEQTRWFCLRH